ncbi:hypothetical protein QVD17_19568 [Tagetes erecta]|uniref:Uncharacterized protein n=1 Tax=Tagetes erecta TaxID=13708 RepID=A0AAD8NX14_TARER|nr:hypothetical protein QVD17_19568 [Tagetes erecta]
MWSFPPVRQWISDSNEFAIPPSGSYGKLIKSVVEKIEEIIIPGRVLKALWWHVENAKEHPKVIHAMKDVKLVYYVNSQRISNVCIDALSAEKPYYFIRLMGRKASHVAVKGKLQLHPNMVIYVEEVDASKLTILT